SGCCESHDADATERHQDRCNKGREVSGHRKAEGNRVVEKRNAESRSQNICRRFCQGKESIKYSQVFFVEYTIAGGREDATIVRNSDPYIALLQRTGIVETVTHHHHLLAI